MYMYWMQSPVSKNSFFSAYISQMYLEKNCYNTFTKNISPYWITLSYFAWNQGRSYLNARTHVRPEKVEKCRKKKKKVIIE